MQPKLDTIDELGEEHSIKVVVMAEAPQSTRERACTKKPAR